MPQFFLNRQILALFLLCACAAFGPAFAAEWTVASRTGEVRVQTARLALDAAELAPGVTLLAPFTVHTGSDGELVISRGEDTLTIGPGSRIEIPEPPETGDAVTRVRQSLGSVLYQIQHRAKALFEVHTPYLVSVVKGTTFNVLSSADTTTVALIEGLLQIRTPDGQADIFLNAGQAAIRSRGERDITVEDQRRVSAPVAGPVRIADGRSRTSSVPADAARDVLAGLPHGADAGPTIDGGTLSIEGFATDPAILQVSGAGLDLGNGISLGETSLALSGAAIGDASLLPALDIGETQIDIGGVSIDGSLNSGIVLDDTSISLGGAAIGATALTPAVDLGGITVDLGASVIGPDLALGDVTVGLGGIAIDETALTPPIALGETTLAVGLDGIDIDTVIDVGIIEPLEISLQIDTPALPELAETIPALTDTLGDTLGGVTGTVLDPVGELLGGNGPLGGGGLKLF